MDLQKSKVTDMMSGVLEYLSHHPIYGIDVASMEQWSLDCKKQWCIWANQFLETIDLQIGTELLETFLGAYITLAERVAEKAYTRSVLWTESQRKDCIQRLTEKHQVEQRTEAWYLDAQRLLTASQFGTLFGGPRTRAKLVMDKATANVDTSQRRNFVKTEYLNPFTWGIRFEPLVKQIYCDLTKTKVMDLGRLRHTTDPRLAASPDGLVYEGPVERLGRFVEFKAPVSRQIVNTIPDDYKMQMQIQMEVGDVEECDYLEVTFCSDYGQRKGNLEETPKYRGIIAVIENTESQAIRYEYSELQATEFAPSTLAENECLVELVPWTCSTWYLTTVGRSRVWFQSIQPDIEAFWRDVDAAKNGTFVIPESTRKRRDDVCRLLDDV